MVSSLEEHVRRSNFGEPSGTRTQDPLIKSQMLYRPELTAHRGTNLGLPRLLVVMPVFAEPALQALTQ